MPNRVRTHAVADNAATMALAPKHLTKQDFGRRLYKLMMGKRWNQSELARQSGLPRDSISTYIRGKSLPTPTNLQSLAEALGVPAEELLPNQIESAIDEDTPSLDIKVSPGSTNVAWLRVNRLVTVKTALKVAELLEADDALRKSGEI